MIGIDTTLLIDILNGEYKTKKGISEQLVICELVYFESLLGNNASYYIDELAKSFKKATFSFQVSLRAAQLWMELRNNGAEIGQIDCLIAATYLENGVNKILTRNSKHFERIPGLEVISY